MHKTKNRILAMLFAVVMLISIIPMSALASSIEYDEDRVAGDDYYKLISKKDWTLAPGIEETEVVLNNADGSKRQVVHSVKVDMNNPYTKIIPGYKGMIPTEGNYGTEATSTQAKNAEKLGYGNVVAATNAMLSWYNSAYYKQNPHLIGEPLYYNILDGYYYENSQGSASFAKKNAVVVINYDVHPTTGEKRPDDMPKVLMRSQTDPLTGWEQNAISVWEWLVKPDENGVPKPTYSVNHTSGHESRTFVGITAEGEIILSVSDGRQAPYSTGFSMYEMGEYMIELGCVYAANCDGGGSTTFVSERPGEELKVNCSLSDGGERPTTNTFLVISTAPASGEFERATISSEYDYYTPGSAVSFTALGTDAVGTTVDVPADIEWAIKEDGMGTISDGVFVSNGTPGTVTAQVIYKSKVVGERSITLAMPDELSFSQPVVTIPYGTKAMIPVKATLNGLFEIGLSADDVIIESSNADLGTVDGLHFIGASTAPDENSSTVTVTLKTDTTITATVTMKLGEGSVVLWDFEDGQEDIDEWNSIVLRNPGEAHRDFYHKLSLATKKDGQVHDGNYSMRLETNGLSSKDVHSQQYAYVRLGLKDQKISLENARSLGFWLYVPEDNIQCWVQGFYKYDSNGDGVPDTLAEVNLMNSENVYYNVDESGWHYLSMDLSDFEKIDLTYSEPFDSDPADGPKTGDKDEFFLALIFHKSINNILWQTNGSINGPFTYYIDNVTVDYSEAVEDREAPIFESVIIDNGGVKTTMSKHDVVTTKSNKLNMVANVVEATYRTDGTGTKHPVYNYTGLNTSSAKVYVDGVKVKSTFANGKLSISDLAVADGYHRVKFEICDKAGNKSTVIRMVNVESGVKASTIKLVATNPSLVTKDRLDFGSIFWMDLVATDIETIKSVTTVLDLNSVNHWQLDNMVLADGFIANYTVDKETNDATITFTRTGNNLYKGEVVLARIPIRIIYFDTDMNIPGYTAETVWTTYNFWPHDLKVDVDMGKITYVDGYNSEVLNAFSNEKFRVNTEMYTDFQSMGSDPYLAEHGTTHVHTVTALDDKAATCVPGYTGRTFCAECNSVVDWGTTIPATAEHDFQMIDGRFVCTIGGELFNGIHKDGTTYYDGIPAIDGWVEVDGVKTYYYINGEKLTGSHFIDGTMLTFNANGAYMADYIYDGFYDYNGKCMFFVNNEYLTGAQALGNDYYYFDENGFGIEGEFTIYGETCTFEKGTFVSCKNSNVLDAGWCGRKAEYVVYSNGLLKVGGSGATYAYHNHGNRPFIDYLEMINKIYVGKDITVLNLNIFSYLIAKEVEFEKGSALFNISTGAFHTMPYLKELNIPESVTTIGAIAFKRSTGLRRINIPASVKSISDTAFKTCSADLVYYVAEGSYAENYAKANNWNYTNESFIRNGFVKENGEIYYYVNGVLWTRRGVFQVGDNFYYAKNDGSLVKDQSIWATVTNDLIPFAKYDFDENGKMNVKHGFVEESGELYYYVSGVKHTERGLFKVGNYYYYAKSGGALLRNCTEWANVTHDLLPKARYNFDEKGRIILKNGFIEEGGELYYYIDGVKHTERGLFKVGNDYYYAKSGGGLLRNCTEWANVTHDLLPKARYNFDASGKIMLKNGFVEEDGELYYYVDGVKWTTRGAFVVGNSYYYAQNGGALIRNKTLWVSVTNGLFTAGRHQFDENGKMVS
ncbi:MAG: phosphodiester glycosidase family protein [Clostridia bacterium]|nr:phosphodiester glycosidase family protein [Clostridia bacterium]